MKKEIFCADCGSYNIVKSGFIRREGKPDKQRYECKSCGKNFVPDALPSGTPKRAGNCVNHPERKAQAKGLCSMCYKRKRRSEGKDLKPNKSGKKRYKVENIKLPSDDKASLL